MNIVKWAQQVSIGSVVVGTLVALTATAAVAYWTSSGNGTASALAGTAQNPTTTAVATVGATLTPGNSGDVTIKVNNPNSYAVKVTSVVNQAGGTITGSGGSCLNTAVTFTNQTGLSAAIAAGGNTTLTFTNAASMGANPDQGCQGATITIPVTVTVSS